MDFLESIGVTEDYLSGAPKPSVEPHCDDNNKRGYFSYSEINKFMMCQTNWYYHYIRKVRSPVTPALLIGGAVGSTFEHFNKQTMYHGFNKKGLLEKDFSDYGCTMFSNKYQEAAKEGTVDLEGETTSSCAQTITECLKAYHPYFVNATNVAAELELKGNIFPEINKDFVGYIDAIEFVDRGDISKRILSNLVDRKSYSDSDLARMTSLPGMIVYDYKTAKSTGVSRYNKNCNDSMQLSLYLIGLLQLGFIKQFGNATEPSRAKLAMYDFYDEPVNLFLGYDVMVKKKGEVRRFISPVDFKKIKQMAVYITRIVSQMESIRSSKDPISLTSRVEPASKDAWLCKPDRCPFYDLCHREASVFSFDIKKI